MTQEMYDYETFLTGENDETICIEITSKVFNEGHNQQFTLTEKQALDLINQLKFKCVEVLKQREKRIKNGR